jgi:hypothetical protein
MSLFFCDHCQKTEDSDKEGLIVYKDKKYCDYCFCEAFNQCQDCGGFSDKFAAATYDGRFCECD